MSGNKDGLDRLAQIIGIVAGSMSILTGIILLRRHRPSSSLSSSCAPCSLSAPPRRRAIKA
jgi:hypothetical protein